MKYTLAVDGSTYSGSVALLRDNRVVAERSLPDSGIPGRGQRGEDFMPMVVDCMTEAAAEVKELERVVCGTGPGSFTSLRIAASIAKGISAGVGCPLYSVSSLLLIPSAAALGPGSYVAALPAMRGETYFLDVDISAAGEYTSSDVVSVVATADAERLVKGAGRILIGPEFGKGLKPHARGVAILLDAILADGPRELDNWEPEYGRLAEAQVKWEAAHGRPLALDA